MKAMAIPSRIDLLEGAVYSVCALYSNTNGSGLTGKTRSFPIGNSAASGKGSCFLESSSLLCPMSLFYVLSRKTSLGSQLIP
jgi:hypothetical protein